MRKQTNKQTKGDTPLHRAALRGHTAAVKALIAAQANVNAANQEGDTPLHRAASNGHAAAVNALIDAGADVHVTDNKSRTALHVAEGRADVVEALLAEGAFAAPKIQSPVRGA